MISLPQLRPRSTWCRLVPLAVLLVAGCEQEERPLQLADLTPGELRIVERMVVLERAKSTALLDRDAGEALLDSLATAWGDSSLTETQAGAPVLPLRAEAFGDLLRRVMAAEQESLLTVPGAARLTRPLPDPAPAAPAPNAATAADSSDQ